LLFKGHFILNRFWQHVVSLNKVFEEALHVGYATTHYNDLVISTVLLLSAMFCSS